MCAPLALRCCCVAAGLQVGGSGLRPVSPPNRRASLPHGEMARGAYPAEKKESKRVRSPPLPALHQRVAGVGALEEGSSMQSPPNWEARATSPMLSEDAHGVRDDAAAERRS